MKRKEKVFFLRERRDGGAAGNERLELPVERSGSTWRHYSRSRSRIGTIGGGNARARAVVSFFVNLAPNPKMCARRAALADSSSGPLFFYWIEKIFFVKTSLSEYYHHVGGARPRRPRSRGHTAGARGATTGSARVDRAHVRARPAPPAPASLRFARARPRRARWRTPPPTRPRRCRTRRRRRCAWWWATCGGACPTRARATCTTPSPSTTARWRRGPPRVGSRSSARR